MDTINLLIHGFNGFTDDMDYLKDYLEKSGHKTCSAELAGHGGSRLDLHMTSHIDWIKSAETELQKLLKEYKTVNLIGFSMGGLIAAYLATKYKVGKLVFINSPIYFWNFKLIILQILKDLKSGERSKIDYYFKSVNGASTKSGLDFVKLLIFTKDCLKRVNNEALILQCTHDETVRYKSAYYIKRKLGDKAKLKIYKGGHHVVFKKTRRLKDEFCKEIGIFL